MHRNKTKPWENSLRLRDADTEFAFYQEELKVLLEKLAVLPKDISTHLIVTYVSSSIWEWVCDRLRNKANPSTLVIPEPEIFSWSEFVIRKAFK